MQLVEKPQQDALEITAGICLDRAWVLHEGQERVDALFDRLSQVEEGRQVVALAKQKNLAIYFATGFRPRVKGLAFPNLVLLNLNEPDSKLVHVLAHELRHVMQEDTHKSIHFARPEFRTILPEALVVQTRVREGDAFLFQTVVAWKMHKAGDTEPFQDLMQMFGKHIGGRLKQELWRMDRAGDNPDVKRASLRKMFDVLQERIGRPYDETSIGKITKMERAGNLRDDFTRQSMRKPKVSFSVLFNGECGLSSFMKLENVGCYLPPEAADSFANDALGKMTTVSTAKLQSVRRKISGSLF